MRRDARADKNQPAVANILKAAGCLVIHTHMLGGGFPDLIVRDPFWRIWLIEVKREGGRLTKLQREFHSEWPVLVVTDGFEALEEMNLI